MGGIFNLKIYCMNSINNKYFLMLLCLFFPMMINAQTNERDSTQRKEYIGKAQTSKQGAGLVLKDGAIYFLKGKSEWEKMYEGKRLIVKGVLSSEEFTTPLKNEKGEYSAGVEGTQYFLENYQLPNVRESISVVVVFKKEISEKAANAIMDNLEYPHWEGMDSSKGKKYFYKTGKKFFLLFPSEKEKKEVLKELKRIKEIYEIYIPDWNIIKD